VDKSNEPETSSDHQQAGAGPPAVQPPKPQGSGIPRSEDLSMIMTRMLLRPRPKTAGILSRFKRRSSKSDGSPR
jgi:hypothetical protein